MSRVLGGGLKSSAKSHEFADVGSRNIVQNRLFLSIKLRSALIQPEAGVESRVERVDENNFFEVRKPENGTYGAWGITTAAI